MHKSKFWNIFKVSTNYSWHVNELWQFHISRCNKTKSSVKDFLFLSLLVLIGWLTRFRKSQGYTHFKIYQFESSRLECLLRAKFLWTDTLDYIVFDPPHLMPRSELAREDNVWFFLKCWFWIWKLFFRQTHKKKVSKSDQFCRGAKGRKEQSDLLFFRRTVG